MQSIRNRNLHVFWTGLAVLALALAAAGPVAAQGGYSWDFDSGSFMGSAAGTSVNGQNGWFTLIPASSHDMFVYTYNSNALGLAQNPMGGDQFLGAVSPGDGKASRAAYNIDLSARGVWTISFDQCVSSTGMQQNTPGSFSMTSLDNTTDTYFIVFAAVQMNQPLWRPYFTVYDAVGNQAHFSSPKRFHNLAYGNWYTITVTIDLDANQLTHYSVTDLSTGTTLMGSPMGVYLKGGSGGFATTPPNFHFFVGGGQTGGDFAGNIMGWDNLSISPGPAAPVGSTIIDLGPHELTPVDKDFGVTH